VQLTAKCYLGALSGKSDKELNTSSRVKMKRSILILKFSVLIIMVSLLIMSACIPIIPPVTTTNVTSTVVPVTPTLTSALTPTRTPTLTPAPTPTPAPTTAPTPAPTPTPTSVQPINHAPIIHYINAPEEVQVSSTNTIICVATDPDQDTLSYSWSADSGNIIGNSDNVQWVAPDVAGNSKITLVVTDNNSAQVSNNVTISVKNIVILPPKIISFTVTRNDKAIYTITSTEDRQISVFKSSITKIVCLVEDPNGEAVNFLWASPLGGQIIGGGNTVNYFASNQPGSYYVMVTVINKSGAESKALVQFHVLCCVPGGLGQ
jgi:hypothetical protein